MMVDEEDGDVVRVVDVRDPALLFGLSGSVTCRSGVGSCGQQRLYRAQKLDKALSSFAEDFASTPPKN